MIGVWLHGQAADAAACWLRCCIIIMSSSISCWLNPPVFCLVSDCSESRIPVSAVSTGSLAVLVVLVPVTPPLTWARAAAARRDAGDERGGAARDQVRDHRERRAEREQQERGDRRDAGRAAEIGGVDAELLARQDVERGAAIAVEQPHRQLPGLVLGD